MWTAWHERQDKAVKGRHKTVMRFLTGGTWERPHFKALHGKKYKGLSEIIVGSGVEWRLIGNRNSGEDTFTIVMICNHKGAVYKPTDALDTAAERWKEMQDGLLGIELDDPPC